MKHVAAFIAILLAAALPLAAQAGGRGGGGGGRGGGDFRSAPARSAPQPSRGGGGFNLNQDVRKPATQPQRPTTQPQRPTTQPQRPTTQPSRPNNNNNGNGNRNNNNNNTNVNRNNTNVNRTNVSGNTVNRTVINNPVYVNNSAWGWNHGVAWGPSPYYWGGGFWGAMAIGVTSAAVYGSIVNSQHQTVYSYQVMPNSPGATLLSNYSLTQTQCGPANLVVVYGPQNSVMCAYPNNLVAAGYYNLDTTTLSLVSTSS